MPVPYYHVVFTLPAAIADIAYQNKAVLYDLLFKVSAETMLTIAADPKHLGARIGITSVLHTWGSALTHHPHVHMIVPGGGTSIDGTRWVPCRPDFILPVKVLSCLFRGLFLARLVAAHRAGRLKFFGVHARLNNIRAFKAYLAPLRKIDWVVYAKRPSEWASMSMARNLPRNSRASTLTCTRKSGRDEIHLLPSAAIPPPGTIMWTWGWWVSAEPQV